MQAVAAEGTQTRGLILMLYTVGADFKVERAGELHQRRDEPGLLGIRANALNEPRVKPHPIERQAAQHPDRRRVDADTIKRDLDPEFLQGVDLERMSFGPRCEGILVNEEFKPMPGQGGVAQASGDCGDEVFAHQKTARHRNRDPLLRPACGRFAGGQE